MVLPLKSGKGFNVFRCVVWMDFLNFLVVLEKENGVCLSGMYGFLFLCFAGALV